MSVVIIKNLSLNYPIYNLSRSFRSVLLRKDKGVKFIKALDNISLELKKGDRLGLMGNNGSGKTTLLKIIGGIFHPSSGEIVTNEKPFSLLTLAWD